MLRSLGQSRLLSLTVAVPFLGSLIIFNQQLVNLLSISPTVIALWTGSIEPAALDELARTLTMQYLYLIYFGLCFLGIASFLFTIFCPNEVKVYSSVLPYIDTEMALITKVRTSLLVDALVQDFLRNRGERAKGYKLLRAWSYPENQERLFVAIFSEIANRVPRYTDEQGDYQMHPGNIDTVLGNINVEALAEVLYNRIRAFRSFWESFDAVAKDNFVIDLMTLRYSNLDSSRPVFRISVAICYGLGFIILFIPTVSTFGRILWRMGNL